MSCSLYAEQESVYIGSNTTLHKALTPKSHHTLVNKSHQGCAGGTICLLHAGLSAFPVVQSHRSNINKFFFSEDSLLHLPLGKCTNHSRGLLNFTYFLHTCNRIDCAFSLGCDLVGQHLLWCLQTPLRNTEMKSSTSYMNGLN